MVKWSTELLGIRTAKAPDPLGPEALALPKP